MSDYMFMLENHLTAPQSRVVGVVQSAAEEAGENLFLAGGAMRDMMGGFPIRDLDFVVEGNALKLARALEAAKSAVILSTDEARRDVELEFSGAVTAQLATSREERYPKPGGKPHVTPAPVYDHLRSRDFSINAIALSLSRASRGLLLDPTNGLADLQSRELRAIGSSTLYDRPVRLFRLIRLKIRLGFTIAEKTLKQYENARAAGVEKFLSAEALRQELFRAASEPNPADVLQAWDQEKLLRLISPLLTGARLNLAALHKLQKARQAIPFDAEIAVDDIALLFEALFEKFTPKEKAEVLGALQIDKAQADVWMKLDARARKLEKELASPDLQKPSHLYRLLSKAPAEVAIAVLMRPAQRVVQDRIRNYFGKYLPAALEVTDDQVRGAQPGTPKFEKLKASLIAKRLDSRPKRPPEPPEPPPAPPSARPRFSPQAK